MNPMRFSGTFYGIPDQLFKEHIHYQEHKEYSVEAGLENQVIMAAQSIKPDYHS